MQFMDSQVLQTLPLTSLTTAVIVVLLTVVFYFIKNRGVLPGPSGIPYLGLYPFLKDETANVQLSEYGKKYGDLYSFTYGGKLFIHLGSVKAMRELYVNKSDSFTNKFTDFNVLQYMLGDGVTMANGESWKIQRKFFIQKFRDYGLSSFRDNAAGPVYDSLAETVQDLKVRQDEPVNIFELLTEKCTGTIRRMVFGEDGISDKQLKEINAAYGASLDGMMGIYLIVMGPFGRLLFNMLPKARSSLKQHDILRRILNTCVKKIESSMNEDHPTCIIEDYFRERNERRRKNDLTWKFFTDYALVSSIAQFVGDGIVGVASFIGVSLNALVEHPEAQQKIYEELMDIVGPSRQPVLEDKSKLTYTNSFMNEVLRTSPIVPILPSLECTKETTYHGYRIPKGAITLQNYWAIHHNPETFEDPYHFNPSRYIQTPGKSKTELPVIFGMGKRSCSGEAFVTAQIFLFLTTIVKNFKLVSSNDPKNTDANFLLTGKLELHVRSRTEK